MSNVIQFPSQEYMVATEGTDNATGQDVFILEYVTDGSRTCVGVYESKLALAQAMIEWEQDGVGGAA